MGNAAQSQDDFDGPEPDATGTGWVRPAGAEQVEAIFVLAGRQLGIGRVGRVTPPVWLKLDELVNLDAIGEPADGVQQVEITMEDHQVIAAGWRFAFCDAVVDTLQRIAGVEPSADSAPVAPAVVDPPSAPVPPAMPEAAPVAETAPLPDPPSSGATDASGPVAADTADVADPVALDAAAPDVAVAAPDVAVAAPDVAVAAPAPAEPAADGPTLDAGDRRTLELEDVVYLGGHPDQTKKRKRCLVTLDGEQLELTGPNELRLTVPWTTVHTVAVQNADEARFRTNTKIHRDASALVLECDDSVTMLLEARECPTIALRTAITQLLDGTPVSVV